MPTKTSAWFGTGGTRTPLHWDNYENLFVQLVGYKYLRMYTTRGPSGVLGYVSAGGGAGGQGNMSTVDLECDDVPEDFAKMEYMDVVLGPGDAVYIPQGVWHYVRGITTSFSVSYMF